MRNARTLARLIWFHVPARLAPGTDPAPERDIRQVMREKRMAIKMIEACVLFLACVFAHRAKRDSLDLPLLLSIIFVVRRA